MIDIFCACCGGKPDDSKLSKIMDEHCKTCEWRYHNNQKNCEMKNYSDLKENRR